MAYDNHEYGRWLPDYWAMLSSLPDEQMAFFNDHFAQSMTGLPYSCQPMDLWIETTMNLNSKSKQGWLQEAVVLYHKKRKQRYEGEGCSNSKSQVPLSP